MTDIVERLRQKERDYYRRDTGGAYGMGPVLRDAADEIERLRGLATWIRKHLVDVNIGYPNEVSSIDQSIIDRIDAALGAASQPSAATENPEAMYSPVAREGHAGASARQIDVAAGDQLVAGQPERCCLDYPRCDCNSPPEPDNAPALQPCGHPWKAQHDFKCILCSSPG